VGRWDGEKLPERVRSLALPQVSRRPVVGSGAVSRARHFHVDPELRHRGESVALQTSAARGVEFRRAQSELDRRLAPQQKSALPELVQKNLLPISATVLVVGVLGLGITVYEQLRASGLFAGQSTYSTAGNAETDTVKTDPMGAAVPNFASRYNIIANSLAAVRPAAPTSGGEPASSRIANDFSFFQPRPNTVRTQPPAQATAQAKPAQPKATAQQQVAQARPSIPVPKPPTRVALAEPGLQTASASPQDQLRFPAQPQPASSLAPILSPRWLPTTEAKTEITDFAAAPFPYSGTAHPLRESSIYADDHVLLHIPAGFDPRKPAVMVVFFHGHGATLARDVRDRQKLPEQISAAGANAVLVAPQFAYDAADSSSGKFWEEDGFKRFLNEAAQKLSGMYGDPHSTFTFANMPIVLVSYSGGYGPALSVLARGGANARIKGIVMLDSLYAGVDQFADWIADHRSTFFVSSYTAGTARHNAELERALAERSVPYGSELRTNHLQGMVSFLSVDSRHRDYVTHAWADFPITDVLTRMDDLPKVESTTARRD
jgi:hypothetical protein